MLSKKEIEEIKEHLEKAQNPLFYFDNDADGLCSYLIFRRFTGKGRGVAVRSYPDLNAQYARKAQELKADYVFVLDKPMVSKEFIEEIQSMHLPIVWIDHHVEQGDDKKSYENVNFYNSLKGKNGGEPITYLAYEITGREEDLWLAVIGCVADHYMPSFAKKFGEHYPSFWGKVKKPFDVYYGTEIGKIAQAFNFGLKDSVSSVVEMQNFLIGCRGPEDVFLELEINKKFRNKFLEVRKKYESLIEKAEKELDKNLLFFDYGGELSISADLSNYLSYKYPGKYIAVAYVKGPISNISLRGKGVADLLKKILRNFEGATGGGHRDAVGARIKSEDLAKFRELMEKEVNK